MAALMEKGMTEEILARDRQAEKKAMQDYQNSIDWNQHAAQTSTTSVLEAAETTLTSVLEGFSSLGGLLAMDGAGEVGDLGASKSSRTTGDSTGVAARTILNVPMLFLLTTMVTMILALAALIKNALEIRALQQIRVVLG